VYLEKWAIELYDNPAIKGFREQCLEAGMDGFLTKPIKPQEMYDAVESVA
jgi:CheY-like chemotaxis protein